MSADSPELLALLAACRASPADDTPRLVLADWLDEHGEHDRAAFIRVQCELAHATADLSRIAELKGLEAELLSANRDFWTGPIPSILITERGRSSERQPRQARWTLPYHYRRGLLHCDPSPYQGIMLASPEVAEWCRRPEAAWLEEVTLTFDNLETWNRLTLPRELLGRVRLQLGVNQAAVERNQTSGRPIALHTAATVSPTAWREFLTAANFQFIRSLQCVCPEAEVLHLVRELGAADLSRLVGLELNCGTEADTAAMILATTPFPALTTLKLGPLSPVGIRALARSPYLTRLYALDLTHSPIGDEGLQALVDSPLAHSLGKVDFPNRGLSDAGLQALARSPLLGRLAGRRLILSMNAIGNAGLEALAQSPHLLRFRELVLRENRIADVGVEALASSPHAANLEHLDFWRNEVGDAGAIALAESPYLNQVVDLCLKENRIAQRGRNALISRFGNRVKL